MVKSLREVGDIQSTPDQIISRATEKVSKPPADPVAGHFRLEREMIQDVCQDLFRQCDNTKLLCLTGCFCALVHAAAFGHCYTDLRALQRDNPKSTAVSC